MTTAITIFTELKMRHVGDSTWVLGIHDGQITYTCPFCGRVFKEVNLYYCCEEHKRWMDRRFMAERREDRALQRSWCSKYGLSVPKAWTEREIEVVVYEKAEEGFDVRRIECPPRAPYWFTQEGEWRELLNELWAVANINEATAVEWWVSVLLGGRDWVPYRGMHLEKDSSYDYKTGTPNPIEAEALRADLKEKAQLLLEQLGPKGIRNRLPKWIQDVARPHAEPSMTDARKVQNNLRELLPPELRWQIFGNRRYIM